MGAAEVIPIQPTAPQASRVLAALRRAYPHGSCLRDFGAEAYTARNRVGDLRRLGWKIAATRCFRHAHSGRVSEYRLVEEVGTGPNVRAAISPVAREASPLSDTDGVAALPNRVAAPTPLALFPEPYRRAGNAR
ncbi:MAG TPA: hypothetical protein VMW80_14235 [Candidatus Dormibacteraeota bacterium]|nr:hypothetical protein [Candidatus Dormibacteraeota bacterium]